MLESAGRHRRCAEAQGGAARCLAAERSAHRQSGAARGECVGARTRAGRDRQDRLAPMPALPLPARREIPGMEAARSELLAARAIGRLRLWSDPKLRATVLPRDAVV